MKNSGIIGFIILAIICYAIMAIGIAAAIIGVIVGLIFLIRWIFTTIKDTKQRTLNQQRFGDELVAFYNIEENPVNPITKPKERLHWIVEQVLDTFQITPQLNKSFNKFSESLSKSFSRSSVWINEKQVSHNDTSSSSLTRHNVKCTNSGYLLDNVNTLLFAVQSKGIRLIFYPNFIIAELHNDYKLIQYSDVTISRIEGIYIAEQSGKIIRGASPVYYNYLHERVDGGPDRRYKNNPSTPVYRHEIFTFNAGENIQFMTASDGIAQLISQGAKEIERAINQFPPVRTRKICDISVSKNEYASAIRELIQRHGKTIILDKKFVNSLKDYGFLKEYPYIFQVIESLKSNNHLDRMIKDDCNYSELELIKESILKTSNHSQDEIDIVLAFLGYGLQLSA